LLLIHFVQADAGSTRLVSVLGQEEHEKLKNVG